MSETTNRTYGYARVSTKYQDLTRQLNGLKEVGVPEEYIVTEKVSGKTITERPEYMKLRNHMLREGDTLVIYELDRLSRDYNQIKEEFAYYRAEGIFVEVVDMPMLSTKGKSGLEAQLIHDIVLTTLAYVANRELVDKNRRTEEGRALATMAGKQMGRPRKEITQEFKNQYRLWMAGEITLEVAHTGIGMGRSTWFARVQEHRTNLAIEELKLAGLDEEEVSMRLLQESQKAQ